jgi:acyl dehydratase
VRFPHPLFEGDTVRASSEILATRESKSRPDAGLVEFLHRAYKQDGSLVAECKRTAFMRKRPPATIAV